MMHFQQLAATHAYRYPAEQAAQEREARTARMAADARRAATPADVRPQPRRSLVPRIAGALGLF